MSNEQDNHQDIQCEEMRIKRLIYRANHRGIKEMDIILGRYANEQLNSLSENELDAFEALMQEHDRDLILWFTGEAEFPHSSLQDIFAKVSAHMTNHHGKAEH